MTVSGRTTIYDVAGLGSEIRLDFALGTLLKAGGELYRPVGPRWLFVAPNAFVDHGERNRFTDDRLVGEYRYTRSDAGVDLGIGFGRSAELRAGVETAYIEETLRVGDPQLPEVRGDEQIASVRFTFDGQDNPVVPSRGVRGSASAKRFFSAPEVTGDPAVVESISNPQQFWQAEIDATAFHSITPRNRIFFRAAAGTSFDAHPYFNDFSLGGPFRMSAYLNDELRGSHFAMAAAGYLWQLPRLPAWAGGHAYLGAWVEAGSAFESRSTVVWHQDIGGGLIIDSMLGPVFVGLSAGPGGHRRFYASLGPLFR
jgi:NTE family protein